MIRKRHLDHGLETAQDLSVWPAIYRLDFKYQRHFATVSLLKVEFVLPWLIERKTRQWRGFSA